MIPAVRDRRRTAAAFVPARDSALVAALDASIDGHSLWLPVHDADERLVDLVCAYTNRRSVFSGHTLESMIGLRMTEAVGAQDNLEPVESLLTVAKTGIPLRKKFAVTRPDGLRLWLDTAAVQLFGGVSISVRDVTEQVRLQLELTAAVRELERLALVDPLTSLANRRDWTARLGRHLAAADQEGGSLAVGLLDLDRFKAYNDTWGHLAGDDLLSEVSRRWREALPPPATIARLGGEEFAVALPNTTAEAAHLVFRGLLRLMPGGQTCSAGVTVWDGAESERSLLARADAALYAAKRAGRDRVETVLPLTSATAGTRPPQDASGFPPPTSQPSGAASS